VVPSDVDVAGHRLLLLLLLLFQEMPASICKVDGGTVTSNLFCDN